MGIELGAKNLYKAYGVPALDLTFADKKSLVDRISGNNLITFTRVMTGASVATYVGADGLIKTAGNNVPRFDHNPATGESLGLLVEEARTNLFTYSEQFDNGYWLKGNCTITPNATTAPDGAITADRLVEDTVNNSHVVNVVNTLSIGTAYTLSTYVKAAGRTFAVLATFGTGSFQRQFFNLTTGQAVDTISGITPSITALPNGWYRIGISFTAAVSSSTEYIGAAFSDSVFAYTGDGTSGIYIWGAQLEAGSFPTSYIPTTTSTVTRSADVASMTGTNFSSWYNQTEGTFFVSGKQPQSFGNALLGLGAGAGSIYQRGSGIGGWFSGGNLLQTANSATWSSGVKVAASYTSSNRFLCLNAGPVASSATTLPNGGLIRIGTRFDAVQDYANGTIARLTYYPVRLPDATLQAITT